MARAGVSAVFVAVLHVSLRMWESRPHVVVTARNAQPSGTPVFGAEGNTQCVLSSLLEVGCRNQSDITHEASSTEAFFSDTHVSAPLGVMDELRSGSILERRCACDEETANLTKDPSQRDREDDDEREF